MASARVKPPSEPYGPEVRDDRIGMSAEELCDRGVAAFEELMEDIRRLHQHLPRKYDSRIRGLGQNEGIVTECFRGAKAKVGYSRRSLEGRGGGG
jgi:hypothetical protein